MESTDTIALNRVLTTVARESGSGVHYTVGSPPVMRKEGSLFVMGDEPAVTNEWIERVLSSFMREDGIARIEKEGEAVVVETFNKILRFRVHVYRQKGFYSLSFRYIPPCSDTITDLHLPAYLGATVQEKTGLTIVSGIHDSGKSTTITAIINTMNKNGPPRYIMTLEDPIERLFSSNVCVIEQREVGKDAASYNQGLKLAISGDIDTVVLSRVAGDKVVMRLFELLEVGKSAIISINSSSTTGALINLLARVPADEMRRARSILSARLLSVLSQKLLHKIGGGRILAYEFLPNTELVPHMIGAGNLDQVRSMLYNLKVDDATPFERSLARLVESGDIHLDDALSEAEHPEMVKQLMR
ncbi:MAG: Flp pilus assembly complex ATPase component TadA [Candidatus Jacksonbacteria bacterium]|nr:Flp pilus assembly complex ATPase component TadA [Candidatus Jacksonbacteria bacterium]